MANTFPSSSCFILVHVMLLIIGKVNTWNYNNSLPSELFLLDIVNRVHVDFNSIKQASLDYGNIVQLTPSAVLYPSSQNDIVSLIKFSYNSPLPFKIAAKGHGHSVRGQAMALNGVVIEMTSLNNNRDNYHGNHDANQIVVHNYSSLYGSSFVDAGGEQLWIDVLQETLRYGLAPVSWTDYLYLTVGGTLSNAGISGQTFRHGPQISNVYEMDVITGKGELVTCSEKFNSELFYAILGGLGQFGIITRARIRLEPAPTRVKWVRMLYNDFPAFTRDQEHLISINEGRQGVDYVEGSLILPRSPANNWRSSSFFSATNVAKITNLVAENEILYTLEVAKYYDDHTSNIVDEELELLFKGLNFIPGFIFTNDVSYVDFLNRVQKGELDLRAKGLWDVPHPWLNIFLPKSHIMDFNSGVFLDIVLKNNITSGLVLVYPMNRDKWDERTSAVLPDEDVFYTVGFLHASGFDGWKPLDEQNEEILRFCDEAGIEVKQYFPHYTTKEAWESHFGSKWKTFKEMKKKFDPKNILSPGQGIFTAPS
ncbi:Cytokinin dehydrogenase 1, FAD/cytokinin binding domain [Dillenia turbinata]|uniref:cytokinin dehydrogenase n=1 Tax=Dillenia turbinata TaxID=194707 RepID=A0AAN8WF45_9MAGN